MVEDGQKIYIPFEGETKEDDGETAGRKCGK